MKNMESRIASARQVLDGHLQGVFSEALAARHWAAVSHCLHAYMELGDGSSAEAAVRQVLVAPAVKKIVAEHKVAHPVAGEPPGRAELLSGVPPVRLPVQSIIKRLCVSNPASGTVSD